MPVQQYELGVAWGHSELGNAYKCSSWDFVLPSMPLQVCQVGKGAAKFELLNLDRRQAGPYQVRGRSSVKGNCQLFHGRGPKIWAA